MKPIFKILLLCAIFVMGSCSEDEGAPAITDAKAEDIIGNWNVTEIIHNGKVRVTESGVTASGDYDAVGKNIDVQISITDNPKNISVTGSYTEDYTIKVLTQTFNDEIPIVLNSFVSSGNWTLNNGIISISQGGEMQQLTITELSSNTMSLEIKIDENANISNLDAELDTRMTISMAK